MTNRKLLLNHLLDIGGVCTMGNLFSSEAKTYRGSLHMTRKLFKFYFANGFIEKMPPIGAPINRAKEVFYSITKKGAEYIGRVEDFKRKPDPKSFNLVNVMHESAKFDVCLSFLRLFPDYTFEIDYKTSFGGMRPDAIIQMTSKDGRRYSFLLEIERKKTVDRTFTEKIKKYEDFFSKGTKSELKKLPHNYRVLFVYTDLTFNVFLRPQEYTAEIYSEIQRLREMTFNLSKKCKDLPNLYRFLAFPDFSKLNQPIWLDTNGVKRLLI